MDMQKFFESLSKRSILVFFGIFIVSFFLGSFLFLLLNNAAYPSDTVSSDANWIKKLQALISKLFGIAVAGDAGGFLQGVWGTAGSLAASFVAIVLAQQALILARKQNDGQSEQEKRNVRLNLIQLKLQREQNRIQAQSNERERVRHEFDLKREIREDLSPLMQSNHLMGTALNTLFVESVKLSRTVSLEVERVIFSERAGRIEFVDADICHAIAGHVNVEVYKAELQSVKSAMENVYSTLSVANGNPIAQLAVAKQLEINGQSGVGRTLFDIFGKDLPAPGLTALAPVDYASFAEHLRLKCVGVIPAVRLVECWFQASLYGVLENESWLKFTAEGNIQYRLDSAGEKNGVLTYRAVAEKLLNRSESHREGLFFVGSLIALHTASVERPKHLSGGPDEMTWRVNLGVLALVDFYNAIPSKEALKLAAREYYGDDSAMSADPHHPNQLYADGVDRFFYEHDSPSMRAGKSPENVRSVLPKEFSHNMVKLDQDIRSRHGEFFNLCIGPPCFTPAQNQYVKVSSIASFRTIAIALKIHAQVNVHYRDFRSYLMQELYKNAQKRLNILLAEMVDLLAFYDPNTHGEQITSLHEMHMRGAAYLEAAATNDDVEFGDLNKCIDLLQDSIKSVQRNEQMSPDSRRAYAASLHDAIQRITVAAGAVQS
jgi:hypothetical protein